MNFCEAIISSAIGTFIGFLGALAIFFFKEWWQNRSKTKAIVDNLKLEIAYNVNLYEKYEEKIQQCIKAIQAGERNLYLGLDYEFIGTHFAIDFYKNGLLLKHFNAEEMRRWNIMLNEVGRGADTFITEQVDEWREEKNNDKKSIIKSLELEESHLKYAKEMSLYILDKL